MNPARRLRPLDPSVSPRFGDVATLLRAPRIPLDAGIDIALVGVPFDLGTNYRTGARGGPAAVREASRTIRLVHPTSRITPFDLCEVADVGDVAINAMDLSASIDAIEAFFQQLHSLRATPITVGGDHTVPLPILQARSPRDRPARYGAVRRTSRHARHADGHTHQPRDHVPPRSGGRADRSEAHGAGRTAR